MKTIDIQLNQAKILSYNVDLAEGKSVPDVTASIGLFSGKKKIATFSLTTCTYYSSGMSFKLPMGMIEPIVEISKQLETILVMECNKQLKRLPAADAIDAETVN